jgi:hypothetical protein
MTCSLSRDFLFGTLRLCETPHNFAKGLNERYRTTTRYHVVLGQNNFKINCIFSVYGANWLRKSNKISWACPFKKTFLFVRPGDERVNYQVENLPGKEFRVAKSGDILVR